MKHKLHNLIVPLLLLGWIFATPGLNCITSDVNEASPIESTEKAESTKESEDSKALNNICKRRVVQNYNSFLITEQSSNKPKNIFAPRNLRFLNSFHSQLIPLRI